MTAEELQEAIRKLRGFAVDHGMQWVIDQIDEATALGVPEERRLRQTGRGGQNTYEDITSPLLFELDEPWQDRQSRRTEEFVRSRPMTADEQAELLVDALRKVLTELDEVANGALEALAPPSFPDHGDAEAPSFAVPHVGTISFAPDDGSTAPAVSMEVIRSSRRTAEVAELLEAIEAEINS